jgi:two-component system, NarL family, response regulator NreC
MPITVLVADDKEVVLSSIRLLLSSDPEIHIVGEVGSFQQTIQSALDLKPQVVVMDLHMPDDLSVSPQEIKSLLDTLGSRLIAMSFWNDQDTQALAQSLGAVILLDKMILVTELIPAIKAAAIKQRTASVTTLDKEGQRADT